jgi:hypothetical protein
MRPSAPRRNVPSTCGGHNGHHDHTRSILKLAAEFQCPLLGVKRTFSNLTSMSANDPKRTWAHCDPEQVRCRTLRHCPQSVLSAEDKL